MFAKALTLASLAAAVFAQPDPSTPDTSNVGADCTIQWTADTTGQWKTMYIELMTGDNLHMKHITTVATVDGTDASNNTYKYPCPDVTPNSAIYFYQFSSPASKDLVWTTRWAIADKDGKTVPPENPTQPDNTGAIKDIPWGTGALVDPSLAVAAPTDVGSQAGGASAGSSASGSASPSASASAAPSGASAPAGGASSGAGASSHSASAPIKSSGAPSGSASGSAPAATQSGENGASSAFAASWVAVLGAGAAALFAL